MSEDHFRSADRRRELGIEPEVALAGLRRARRFNNAALETLRTEVPAAIDDLRDRLRANEPGDIAPYVDVLTDMALRDLAETGWDVYHVREGKQLLDQAVAAGRHGADAVCDRLVEAANRLTELRETRERQNDPVNAVCAGVCFLAAIALMSYAAAPGGPAPTDPSILIPFAALLIFGAAFTVGALSVLPWAAVA
jgi:hypothetical protein